MLLSQSLFAIEGLGAVDAGPGEARPAAVMIERELSRALKACSLQYNPRLLQSSLISWRSQAHEMPLLRV
jgi:hypothetical protein